MEVQNPTTQCYLLDLPPELRNEIYEFVLAETYAVSDLYTQTPFAQTCRQIRNEAYKIFYQINTFRFDLHLFASVQLEKFRDCIHEIHHFEIHTGLMRAPWVSDHHAVLCMDVSQGMQQLKYEFHLDPYHRIERHGPSEGCYPCKTKNKVLPYLDRCRGAARADEHMTLETFECVAKILVDKTDLV